jgi:lysozyme
MKVTQQAIDLIKEFEGLRLKSYKDPVGIWTIGYGTTSNAGIGVSVADGMKITAGTAEKYLRAAVDNFANDMRPLFTRVASEHEFGAMVSLAYNIGIGAFGRSTCLKRFNAGDVAGAAEALQWFNKAGGKVLRGLVRRRSAEADMMLGNAINVRPEPRPDPVRNNPAASTTLQGGVASATGILGAGGAAIGSLDGNAQVIAVVCLGVALLGVLWMMRRRLVRFAAGDR